VTPGAAGLKGREKGPQGHPRLGFNPEAAGPKGAGFARGAILPRVFPDDPARPYFWLPHRIAGTARAYCERHGVRFDQLLAQQLTRFISDGAYRHRMAEWACTDSGWPEDLADCLAGAALRAARYHEAAEAALLNLSPEGLAVLEQEAIRRGLGYDELAAQVLIERLRGLNGEASPGPGAEGA
jgi:hypothetical protein